MLAIIHKLLVQKKTRLYKSLLILSLVAFGLFKIYTYFRWDNFGVVVPEQIYRSGQLRPFQLKKMIERHKIKTILRFNIPELSLEEMAAEEAVCRQYDVAIVRLIMTGDGLGEFSQYDEALAVLQDSASLPVLITCARGTYRTGAIVVLYRVAVQGWAFEKALQELKQYRFEAGSPDIGHPLIAHLHEYLKRCVIHE